jgi:CHAT domain-containing protein
MFVYGCVTTKTKPLSKPLSKTESLPPNLSIYLKDYKKVYHTMVGPWINTGLYLEPGNFVQMSVTGKVGFEHNIGGHNLDPSMRLFGRIGKEGDIFKLLRPNNTGKFLVKGTEEGGNFFIGYKHGEWDIKGKPKRETSYYKYFYGEFIIDILIWKKDDPEFILTGLEELFRVYPDNPRIRSLLANQKSKVAFNVLAKKGNAKAIESLKRNITFRIRKKEITREDLFDLGKDYYRVYLLSKQKTPHKREASSFFKKKALDTMRLALKKQPFLDQLTGDDQETLFFKTEYLEVIKNISQKLPKHKSLGFCYCSIGRYYHNIGLYNKAIVFFQKASEIAKKEGYKHIESLCIILSSYTFIEIGDFEKAICQANRIIERYDNFFSRLAKKRNPLHRAWMILGQAHFYSGNYKQSSIFADKVIGISGDYENFCPAVGCCLKGYLSVYQEKTIPAKEYFQKSNRQLGVSTLSGSFVPYIISCNQLGLAMAYILEKNYEKALEILKADATQITAITWRRQALFAQIYKEMGQEEKALEHLKKAIEIIERTWRHLGSHEYKMVAMVQRETVYHDIVSLLFQMKRYDEAFNYAELARGRAFVDLLGNRKLKPKDETILAMNNTINELREELKQMKGEIALAKDSETMRELNLTSTRDIIEKEKSLEEEIRNLKKANFEFMSTTMVEPLSLAEVKKLLPGPVSLISFFVTDECTYVWVIDKDKMTGVRIPVSQEKLERLVRIYRMNVMEKGTNRDLVLEQTEKIAQDPKKIAKELYDFLFEPLKDHITNRRICIVPHDILHYLPFSALYDGSKYVVEDYTIFYNPSATVLKYCFDKHRSGKNQFFGMGNPKLEKASYDLPFAQKEVEEISSNFLDSEIFCREKANEERFKKMAGKEELIHLACHGEYKSDAPLLSNLRLAPSKSEDGRLEVHEIFDLDLKPNLVVLSACQTGMGKRSSGDEITGLTRAFIYAGTPSIITTLWSVNDQSTAELMTSFYEHFKNQSKIDALRAAQLELMKKYPHPFYWAPFCLTGDYQ